MRSNMASHRLNFDTVAPPNVEITHCVNVLNIRHMDVIIDNLSAPECRRTRDFDACAVESIVILRSMSYGQTCSLTYFV